MTPHPRSLEAVAWASGSFPPSPAVPSPLRCAPRTHTLAHRSGPRYQPAAYCKLEDGLPQGCDISRVSEEVVHPFSDAAPDGFDCLGIRGVAQSSKSGVAQGSTGGLPLALGGIQAVE